MAFERREQRCAKHEEEKVEVKPKLPWLTLRENGAHGAAARVVVERERTREETGKEKEHTPYYFNSMLTLIHMC